MFDAEDREIVAQAAIWMVAVLLTVVMFAAAVGLAWNVFEFMRGF